jgi:hypothetical protein
MKTTVSCRDWLNQWLYPVYMMTDNADRQMHYEIKVHGKLDDQWQAWFDDLCTMATVDGDTILHGTVVDQAALYGILRRVNNLGLRLISVNLTVEDRHKETPP